MADAEETHIARLVFALLHDAGISDDDFDQGIADVKKCFRFDCFDEDNWTIDFSKPANLWAYMYLYFALGVGLARDKIAKAIINCAEFRDFLRSSQALNIVCLGGGPGADFLGFCLALSEKIGNRAIRLTIADKTECFRECFEDITVRLRGGGFGKMSSVFQESDIQTEFMAADLTRPVPQVNLIQKLRDADIVIMKSVMSILPSAKKPLVINLIENNLKDGGLFLHIDSPFVRFCNLQEVYSTAATKPGYLFRGAYTAWSTIHQHPVPMKDTSKAEITIFAKP